jgi:hypothetical protein
MLNKELVNGAKKFYFLVLYCAIIVHFYGTIALSQIAPLSPNGGENWTASLHTQLHGLLVEFLL